MKVLQPLKLTKFSRYTLDEISIGEIICLSNGREGVQVKIVNKSEQKGLLKGEVLFYLIRGNDWTKGDHLIFSPNSISLKGLVGE